MLNFDNLEEIRLEAAKTDRKIYLVAASKMQPKEVIDELMTAAPDLILGENRVQELRDKYDSKYIWHIIGQLQTNKVKYIIDKAELIHSLDRLELADEIQKQAAKINKVQNCLVEVNTGAEITKGGVEPDKLIDFVKSLEKYDRINVQGIMSVLPNLGDTPELNGLYDRLYMQYKELQQIKQVNLDVKYLSAGMSGDYKVALKHGANMIRLGRVLFGERVYPTNSIS